MVSLWDAHVQHMGELAFLILCRCFLSGMWIKLSCVHKHGCLLCGRHSVSCGILKMELMGQFHGGGGILVIPKIDWRC